MNSVIKRKFGDVVSARVRKIEGEMLMALVYNIHLIVKSEKRGIFFVCFLVCIR